MLVPLHRTRLRRCGPLIDLAKKLRGALVTRIAKKYFFSIADFFSQKSGSSKNSFVLLKHENSSKSGPALCMGGLGGYFMETLGKSKCECDYASGLVGRYCACLSTAGSCVRLSWRLPPLVRLPQHQSIQYSSKDTQNTSK